MRGELSHFYGINKVFVIGAGFSVPAGLPLTNELLQLLHRKACKKKYYNLKGEVAMGQAEVLLEELRYYYPMLDLTHERIRSGGLNYIDLEEFLSFIAAESAFLHPSDHFNEHGSKFLAFLKLWLGEVIYERQIESLSALPDFYNEFIKGLKNSLILTFNWDTLIENLFDSQKIKYRYQLNVENFEERSESIPLLKLHGSIDWVSSKSDKESKMISEEFTNLGYGFKNLKKINGDLRIHYNNYLSPWIIVPNYDKLNQLKTYGELWETPIRYLNDNLEVIFIGFSFRKDDFHTRAFMYPKLVKESKSGQLKVKVIDYAKNKSDCNEIKQRFKGIENCEFWLKGFNSESLNFIFE
ncbi:MAG: SIR2 family protein [Bacteroidota bacterium]|nr:SIR2 family protein [Bacteroidota bacterium]